MLKYVNSSADVRREAGVSQPESGGCKAGTFLLRRARYFNETGLDATGRSVGDADISEAAFTETIDESLVCAIAGYRAMKLPEPYF